MTNTTTRKATKISDFRGELTYTFGDWIIYVTRRSESTYSCGLRRTTNWSTWQAHTRSSCTTESRSAEGSGGVLAACASILKLEA